MIILKKIWFSLWFRIIFILFGIWWEMPLMFYIGSKYNIDSETTKNLTFGLYMGLFMLGCAINNPKEESFVNYKELNKNE